MRDRGARCSERCTPVANSKAAGASDGVPDHIRSDNGPEFTSRVVRGWLERVGVKTLFIEPGSPWENGYVESFNGKLRDDCRMP